jgi:hypothetical protein
MGSAKAAKRYCWYFFGTIVLLFAVLLCYVFVFDPWQLFHQPWFRKPTFISNARFQDAGIINSYDFDSVILGNSMAENFSAQEASQVLGGTFVNLSMAGSLFSERQIVLEHLFQKKHVKKIIISIDYLPTIRPGQYSQDLPPEKYAFLYNRNPFDDFRLYFDVNLFRCWHFLENNSCWDEIPGSARVQSLDKLYKWFPYYVKAFGGPKAWCSWSKQSAPFRAFLEEIIRVAQAIQAGQKDHWTKELIAESRHNSIASFEQHLLPFMQEHPETEFLLFFPPYSRLWFAMQEQYYAGYYQSYLFFLRGVFEKVAQLPNVQLFGFDNQEFTGDLANYKDQSHYHKKINAKLLHLMAERKGLLRKDTIDLYISEIKDLASKYDIQGFAAIFQQCLQEQAAAKTRKK